jgi:hypothetical protein
LIGSVILPPAKIPDVPGAANICCPSLVCLHYRLVEPNREQHVWLRLRSTSKAVSPNIWYNDILLPNLIRRTTMTKVLVEEGYQLSLPPELQSLAPVGSEFEVTVDEVGRIILTPESQIRTILLETFGMWSDRNDLISDGIEFMDDVRQGQRLDQLGITTVETD